MKSQVRVLRTNGPRVCLDSYLLFFYYFFFFKFYVTFKIISAQMRRANHRLSIGKAKTGELRENHLTHAQAEPGLSHVPRVGLETRPDPVVR